MRLDNKSLKLTAEAATEYIEGSFRRSLAQTVSRLITFVLFLY